MYADTLIHNARAVVPDAPKSVPRSVALSGGRIVGIGNQLLDFKGPQTRVIDAEGCCVVPGFNDAHVHIWKVGQLQTVLLDLRECQTLDDMYQRVQNRLRDLKPGEWLMGRGWNEARLKGSPERRVLDSMSMAHPIVLTRTCAHIHAVNSQALERAGITPETPVPFGGEIDWDKGLVFETAYGLLQRAFPAWTQSDYERWILAGARHLRRLGITSATDPAVDPELYKAYRNLASNGTLPIRVNLLYIRRPDGGHETYSLPQKCDSPFLKCDSVKFFADGGLSGATAAISEPYVGVSPPQQGILRFATEELFALALEAHEAGFRIGTHAIGDRAIEQVLDVYSRLYERSPSPIRHRIEHLGLATDAQLERIRTLGCRVVTQPIFLRELRENFVSRLSQTFLGRCYAFNRMLHAGIPVAFSSDGPVVRELSPLEGMRAAVLEALDPSENISVDAALWAYTAGGALAGGDLDNRGSLEVGKWADFIVLNKDPLATSIDDWDDLGLKGVWVNGVEVETSADL